MARIRAPAARAATIAQVFSFSISAQGSEVFDAKTGLPNQAPTQFRSPAVTWRGAGDIPLLEPSAVLRAGRRAACAGAGRAWPRRMPSAAAGPRSSLDNRP